MSRPLRIGIDARSVRHELCGVSRVATRLVKALSAIDTANRYFIYTENMTDWPGLGTNFKVVTTGCPRSRPWMDWRLYRLLKKDRLDVFHSIHSWLPLCLPKGVRAVVTIHDLFAATDPDFFAHRGILAGVYRTFFKQLLRDACRRAEAIVTISRYSAREIEAFYPAVRGKITIISNGVGIDHSLADTAQVVGCPYLLYVGNCRSYKDPDTLMEGYALYRKRNPGSPLSLVVAGNDSCTRIKALVSQLGLTDFVRFVHGPGDAALASLYRGCLALVATSRYEGFGIPVLEAMAFGKPVITSDADAFTEVAADAALTFRRGDAMKLAERIAQIETHFELRNDLVARGLRRSKIFDWRRSAEALRSLYELALTTTSS